MGLARLVSLPLAVIALVACGSRTGLDVEPRPSDATPIGDAGRDRTSPPERDASHQDSHDARRPPPHDAFVADVFEASPPPFGVDSGLFCDAGLPTAYLFDEDGSLYTFDPATRNATLIGTPNCNAGGTPWTISVSREGDAYLVFEDWFIYRVDLATMACERTPFLPNQLGITEDFAIAVSRTPGEERFYVYGVPESGGPPILATSDLSSFELTLVGPTSPVPNDYVLFDMQADLLGNLYVVSFGGEIVDLTAATGAVVSDVDTVFLSGGGGGGGSLAVMTYQDDVYAFRDQIVAIYDRGSGSFTQLGAVNTLGQIVGASAIPCYGTVR